MHGAVLALFAALMGAASVEFFGRACKGLLGALAPGFRVYLQEQGLGASGLEQLASFLACTWRMAAFVRTVRADVEAMFDPG